MPLKNPELNIKEQEFVLALKEVIKLMPRSLTLETVLEGKQGKLYVWKHAGPNSGVYFEMASINTRVQDL